MTTTVLTNTESGRSSTEDQKRSAVALRQLPEELRTLNQLYLDRVNVRGLLTASECTLWLEKRVTVFLRHDQVCVFALVCGENVGMADFVELRDVCFHVDESGRQQSNAGAGPLPNRRTVHAYLTGTLQAVADSGQLPDAEVWEPIRYLPLKTNTFFRDETEQPIRACDRVIMVSDRAKVWCPRILPPQTGLLTSGALSR